MHNILEIALGFIVGNFMFGIGMIIFAVVLGIIVGLIKAIMGGGHDSDK